MSYLKASEMINELGFYNRIQTIGSGLNAMHVINLGSVTKSELNELKLRFPSITFISK